MGYVLRALEWSWRGGWIKCRWWATYKGHTRILPVLAGTRTFFQIPQFAFGSYITAKAVEQRNHLLP